MDLHQRRVGAVRRMKGIVLALCGIIALFAGACRGSTFQIYEFQPLEAELAFGGTMEVHTVGHSSGIDSAGLLIDRISSPYSIGIYITGHAPGAVRVDSVRLVGVSSGRQTLPVVSPTTVFDSLTLTSVASDVDLAFEDQRVTVQLAVGVPPRVRHETVELLLRTHYQERHISFLEWLSHI